MTVNGITVIIVLALLIALELTALFYLDRRRQKARKLKEADEALAKAAKSPEEITKPAEPAIEIPGTSPLQELTKLPEVTAPSTLPEEAKSTLMNAVWYRCENPKCNFTQFLEVYHIVPEDKDGTNSLDNLVVLCPKCRFAAYSDELTGDELRSWVKERVERFKFAIDWPYK